MNDVGGLTWCIEQWRVDLSTVESKMRRERVVSSEPVIRARCKVAGKVETLVPSERGGH